MRRSKSQSTAENGSDARTDLLARAYLEIMAREAGAKIKPMLRGKVDEIDRLIEDLDGDIGDAGVTPLRADLAALTILIARAIEAEPGLARRLRREAPVVSISTHSPHFVEMAKEVVQNCVLPAQARVLETGGMTVGYSTRAAIVARDGTAKEDRPEKGNREVVTALQHRIPIVGIAPDPARHLPQALMRTAEYRLSIPALDQSAVALVVEAVTGRSPTRDVDPDLVRLVDIDDLPLAFRSGRTGDSCVDALEELVRTKGDYLISGPSLEELPGYGEAREWGLQLAEDLADYKAGRLDWADVDHKGLLLSGVPGTGKTQFARALAKQARVPLIATSVAQWNAATYLSGTLQAIRDAFGQARRQAPSILFIDEMDGISDRSKLRGDHVEYWSQIVNLVLEQLAGIEERQGVVVVAATNHPDRIDPAVKRAGRLDREIQIQKPGTAVLAEIFRFHIGREVLPDEDLVPVALAARGATGADVEAFVRRAKGTARRAGRDLTLDDLMATVAENAPVLLPQDRWRIAVHESGHALVSHALNTGTVWGISIHTRGGCFEFQSELTGSATFDRLQREISVLLGGREAERLVLGEVSIGSGMNLDSDLGRATGFALLIETQCGMGRSGSAYLPEVPGLGSSPELHTAVNLQLENAEERAVRILEPQQVALVALATALDRRGYLSRAEIEAIISESRSGGKTADGEHLTPELARTA